MKQIEKGEKIIGDEFHSYFWGKESSEKFLRALKANEKDLEDLTDPSVICPEDLREQFTKTVLSIADSAGINKRGKKA